MTPSAGMPGPIAPAVAEVEAPVPVDVSSLVPGEAQGLPLTLPRAPALTSVLLAPPGPSLREEDVSRLRALLESEALAVLSSRLSARESLRLDGFSFDRARHRPEHLRADLPFSPSPATCRRAIGVAAVRLCVARRASSPWEAVRAVVDAGVADMRDGEEVIGVRPPWWAEWYLRLPLAGQAVVQAEAVSWASALWSALDWRRFERTPVIGGRDEWWDCPGRPRLTLVGRAEVRARLGRRTALLVVGTGSPRPDWRSDLGYPALVSALRGGECSAPARVVGLWPASGHVRILGVDFETLLDTANAVVSALPLVAAARPGVA